MADIARIFRLFVHLVFFISTIQAQSFSNTPSIQLRDTIPAECSNPPLRSCAFYLDCLENRDYNCGASGYPLAFGQHYCQVFKAAQSTFSPQGQVWLTNTMHCLQVALVPEATGQVPKLTCSELYHKAFATHATCYVDNGFCRLPWSDMLQIVKLVRKQLFQNLDAISATIEAVVDCVKCTVTNACPQIASL